MASAIACGSTMTTRDLELRSVIKFLTKEGKKPIEVYERMNAVYGVVSTFLLPGKVLVQARESIEGDSSSDQPVEAQISSFPYWHLNHLDHCDTLTD